MVSGPEATTTALRHVRYLAGDHGDERVAPEPPSPSGQSPPGPPPERPGGDGGGVGAAEDQAVQSPQLLLQQAHGIFQPRSAQGVGAAKLGKLWGHMGGVIFWLHLPQGHGDAPPGQLPGGILQPARPAPITVTGSIYSPLQRQPSWRLVAFLVGRFLAVVAW